jgi:hypothetical protein
MLQGWWHKVVRILLYHDCIELVGTTLQQDYQKGCCNCYNKLFQTCWQLGTSSVNTTCWQTCYKMWDFCFVYVIQKYSVGLQEILSPGCTPRKKMIFFRPEGGVLVTFIIYLSNKKWRHINVIASETVHKWCSTTWICTICCIPATSKLIRKTLHF